VRILLFFVKKTLRIAAEALFPIWEKLVKGVKTPNSSQAIAGTPDINLQNIAHHPPRNCYSENVARFSRSLQNNLNESQALFPKPC
jgi:hypothetical protein